MIALFANLPEAPRNSVEIALRCAYRPLTRKPILPRFAVNGGIEAEAQELRAEAATGLAARLAAHGPAPGFTAGDYRARLAFELDVIVKMNFPGYFLIVADFIKHAKSQDIPVGPGRGRGPGPWLPMRLRLPISIRSASVSCSSASSIRNAFRCRISISISVRRGATK